MATQGIEWWQTKRIHHLINKLGIDEDTYRGMLATMGVTSSKELDRKRANQLIDKLGSHAVEAGVWKGPVRRPAKAGRRAYATAAQLRKLKYHAIACGLHYADLASFKLTAGDQTIGGNDLRAYLRRRFDLGRTEAKALQGELPIPGNVLRHMYTDWINPTTNRFLYEGGYRVDNGGTKCYYDRLTPDEVQYLINRYREMHRVLDEQSTDVQLPTITQEDVEKWVNRN